MIAPKPVSDTGLSPEQEQALALARARRRRAEAEATKPAPVTSKAPPAPVAKPGPAVPAVPQAAPPAPVARPGAGFEMMPSSPQARRDMMGAQLPQPKAAAPGAQYSWTPPTEAGTPEQFAAARTGMDARAKADAERITADAEAAREAKLSAERREAAAAYGAGMDMIITTDDQGQLRPGSSTDDDIAKGIITSPIRAVNAGIGAGEALANLYPDAINSIAQEFTSGPGMGKMVTDAVPRASIPRVPVPEGLESTTGGLMEGLGQFLIARKLVGSVAPGGGLAANIGKDALAIGVGYDGSTGRLADMFDLNAIPEGPLRDYAAWLQTQPDDSPYVGRFKNMIEDMTGSGPLLLPQGAIRGVQAVGDALTPKPIAPANAGGAGVQAALAQSRVAPQAPPVQAPPVSQAAPQAPPAAPGAVVQAPPPAAVAQTATPPVAPVGPPPLELTPAQRKAADLFIRKMEADGLTVDDIRKIQASLSRRGDSGVYETAPELAGLTGKSSGANLRGLAMAAGAAPGPAQEALIGRVAENTAKLSDRLSRGATRATGQSADNAVATLDDLDMRLRTEAKPRYEAFYAAEVNPKIYGEQIAPVLNAPHGQAAMERAARGLGVEAASLQARVASGEAASQAALQRTYDAAQALRANLEYPQMLAQARKAAETGDAGAVQALAQLEAAPPAPIPPIALDHVKRAFDDLIDEAGQATYTASNLRGAKRNFAESVSRATGGAYGEALGTYENIKRLEEAFDIGLGALKQPTWQLQRSMSAGNRGAPFSGGEVEAIAMGVARHIEDLIEAGDQRALTTLMKGKALQNIATALGSDKAARLFEQTINRLAANREFGRRVAGGSDTAMRQAAIRDAGVEQEDMVTRALDRAGSAQAPPSAFSAVYSAIAQPAVKAGKDIYRQMRYPGVYDPKVNAELAPMLANAMRGKDFDELIAKLEARVAQKKQRGGKKAVPAPVATKSTKKPAPASKIKSSRKPPAKTGGKKPPQSNASPMVTGALIGGAAGAAAAPEDARGIGLVAGLAGGAVLGNRLSKMGGSKPKTVKPPPGAGGKPQPVGAKAALDPDLPPPPKERFLVGSDGSRKSLGTAGEEKTVKFTAPSGKQFQIEFRRDGDAMGVDFREVGAKAGYKPTGTGSAGEANAVLSAVQDAIKSDVSQFGRPRYTFVGETAQQSRIYQNMARTTEPPKGYRWEGPDSNGAVHLQRADLAPPSKGPGGKPPPVQAEAPKPPPAAKPKNALGGIAGRAVAGGAIGGLVGALGGDASAQDDLAAEIMSAEGKISAVEQEIAALKKAKADFDKITDPFEKQRFLKANGLYAGDIDGDIRGMTTVGINRWNEQNARALEKAEKELAAGKRGLDDLRKQDAYRQMQKEQNPFFDAVREFGPSGAAILGGVAATVLRMRGVGKSAKAVKQIENDINDLLTNGPVRGLLKKGGAANQPRNRAVNMNEFYRRGGAPDDKLPFNYGQSGWKPNPKAAKPGSLYSEKTTTKMDGVGSTLLRPTDIKVIGAGLLDSALVTPFVSGAEEELKKAQADVENGNESIEALRRVEKAKTDLAMYQAIQRLGWGVAGAGALGMAYRYKLPRPDIRGAEDEVTAIADYLKSIAPTKPKKSKKP